MHSYSAQNSPQDYSGFLSVFLQVVEADIFSEDSLRTHFKGQDVIMSCLGFPASIFSAVTGYTLSMKAVIGAMREARVNRVITMTSWYTQRESGTHGDAFKAFSDLLLEKKQIHPPLFAPR